MTTLLKLVLFPVVLVFALLGGAIRGIFGAKYLKYIPKAIVHLADDPSPFGTAFEEIKFPQLIAYAEERGVITSKNSNHVEFMVDIDGGVYSVSVSRALDGSNCAILRSRRS